VSRVLILLSCSRDKRTGGETFDPTSASVVARLSTAQQRRFVAKRQEVFELLHRRRGATGSNDLPRLYNDDQAGGYRDERAANMTLAKGPDFGGEESSGLYLPGYRRYAGRFFVKLAYILGDFWSELPPEVEVVFVSALYGMVLWNELIQNYDCHFLDVASDRLKKTVATYWGDVLTDSLSDLLKTEKAAGRPFTRVYDLLTEPAYQQRFDWERPRNFGAKTYHIIFRDVLERDLFGWLAEVLASNLRSFFSDGGFKHDEWYSLSDAAGGNVKFGFEEKLGANREATQDTDIEDSKRSLKEEFPKLRSDVLDRLTLAEHSWRKVISVKSYDFGVTIVSFAKAAELALRLEFNAERQQLNGLANSVRNSSMQIAESTSLASEVDALNELRQKGAHPDSKMPSRKDVEHARDLTHRIIRALLESGPHRARLIDRDPR
jgi:hypothetical protein